MLTYEDIPRELNLASWFVDRNVEEGRGARTALIGPRADDVRRARRVVNRSGHVLRELGSERGARAARPGRRRRARGALVRAQKIGAVTAEAYTFLQPKDYAYYLDYARAGVVVADASTLERVREAAATSRWLRHVLVVGADRAPPRRASFEALAAEAPEELEAAPTTRDDIALWKFTTGSTGLPKAAVHPQHSPLLSFDWYARGVLEMTGDDVDARCRSSSSATRAT